MAAATSTPCSTKRWRAPCSPTSAAEASGRNPRRTRWCSSSSTHQRRSRPRACRSDQSKVFLLLRGPHAPERSRHSRMLDTPTFLLRPRGATARSPFPPLSDRLDPSLDRGDARPELLVFVLQLVQLRLLLDFLRRLGVFLSERRYRLAGVRPKVAHRFGFRDSLELILGRRVSELPQPQRRPESGTIVGIPNEHRQVPEDLVPPRFVERAELAKCQGGPVAHHLEIFVRGPFLQLREVPSVTEVRDGHARPSREDLSLGTPVHTLHDRFERLLVVGLCEREGRRVHRVIPAVVPVRLGKGLERDFISPEITEGAVHAPAHPTVFVLRPAQERVSRGRRPDLPEGHGRLASDPPEFVFLEDVLEALDCLGVSGQLAEIPARFDPRPDRHRVRELPQQLVPRLLECHLLQERVVGVEQDRPRASRRVEPEDLVRLLDANRFPLGPIRPREFHGGRYLEQRHRVLDLLRLLRPQFDLLRRFVPRPGEFELRVAGVVEPLVEEDVEVPSGRLFDRLLEIVRLDVLARELLHVLPDRLPP